MVFHLDKYKEKDREKHMYMHTHIDTVILDA